MNPGEVFDGTYRIERTLGEGGFATVYAALDPGGARVALKVLKVGDDGGYDVGTRGRFQREIEIVKRLESPHTVRLLSAGEASSGELYAVFEQIPGQDLAELLDSVGRLEPHWVSHILRQLLDALGDAHRKGLLHRDIKPENVRVFAHAGDPMFVKLLDFGIARATDDGHPSITRTGELIGTPRYMAPEQLTERPLSPASDLYSLGVMMFELLLGRDAMSGTSWGAQLERLQTGHVFSFPEMERIGPGLLRILQRLTARRPRDRFQNAASVLEALDHPEREDEEDVFDVSPTIPVKAERARPETPRRLILLGALLVLASGVLLVMLVPQREQTVAEPKARPRADISALTNPEPEGRAPSNDEPATSPDAGSDVVDGAVALPPEDPSGGTAGCGKEPIFTEGGVLRGAEAVPTYVPSGYRKNYKHPLIILLHQDAEPAGPLLAHSGFVELSEPDHFVVIAPEHPDVLSAWREDERDIPIVLDAYELAADHLCIDPKRVFVVGNSQGSRAASFLSCVDWVAGVGMFAFGNGNQGHHCRGPAPPKPIVLITPDSSPHVPIAGGESCTSKAFRSERRVKLSIDDLEANWKARNHCSSAEPQLREDGDHRCSTWSCSSIVHSCRVRGGHGWPGSSPRLLHDAGPCSGPPPTDFAVAREFWRVFRTIGLPE